MDAGKASLEVDNSALAKSTAACRTRTPQCMPHPHAPRQAATSAEHAFPPINSRQCQSDTQTAHKHERLSEHCAANPWTGGRPAAGATAGSRPRETSRRIQAFYRHERQPPEQLLHRFSQSMPTCSASAGPNERAITSLVEHSYDSTTTDSASPFTSPSSPMYDTGDALAPHTQCYIQWRSNVRLVGSFGTSHHGLCHRIDQSQRQKVCRPSIAGLPRRSHNKYVHATLVADSQRGSVALCSQGRRCPQHRSAV